ncbi:hypothetical protein LX32DRAFT_190174 [Colletotrichum zoysiae]|uniref:Uncharacterized protein n=1 Tax=Colletotrichum zoysiae TaxID=1216348 RepID=A0AAD9LVD3_9PEZI|nr:hypothetical protein LX32DRAFT_190174 [Colletotrichum zoysiae]
MISKLVSEARRDGPSRPCALGLWRRARVNIPVSPRSEDNAPNVTADWLVLIGRFVCSSAGVQSIAMKTRRGKKGKKRKKHNRIGGVCLLVRHRRLLKKMDGPVCGPGGFVLYLDDKNGFISLIQAMPSCESRACACAGFPPAKRLLKLPRPQHAREVAAPD